jgi:hypothetical protein
MTAHLYEDNSPDDAEDVALLEPLWARLDQARARWELFEVRPGSDLAVEDAATAYNPISHQVQLLFGAAFDHAGTLQRTLAHGMPVVAAYPLIRASLESAAQVLWLTKGGTRSKRVFRALHRVWDMAEWSDKVFQHLIPGRQAHPQDLRTRLEELLRAAKAGQRKLDQTYPRTTDILIEAGRFVQSKPLTPVDVWRLCSSMAHGNSNIAMSILKRHEEGARTPTGSTYRITTSYRTIAAFVGVLVEVIDAALEAQDLRNA